MSSLGILMFKLDTGFMFLCFTFFRTKQITCSFWLHHALWLPNRAPPFTVSFKFSEDISEARLICNPDENHNQKPTISCQLQRQRCHTSLGRIVNLE